MFIAIPFEVTAWADNPRSDTARHLWKQRKKLRQIARDRAKGQEVRFIGVDDPLSYFPKAKFEIR